MNKTWMSVVIAALFEVGWVIGLKHASGLLEWGFTLVAIIISFSLMIAASRTLPVGTVYAVFVGLVPQVQCLQRFFCLMHLSKPEKWYSLVYFYSA